MVLLPPPIVKLEKKTLIYAPIKNKQICLKSEGKYMDWYILNLSAYLISYLFKKIHAIYHCQKFGHSYRALVVIQTK